MSATETKYDYERAGTFSERFPILYNETQRNKKAAKVIAVCRDYSSQPLETLTVLDLGASTGIMAEYFSRHFRRVIALDVDKVGLISGQGSSSAGNIDYLCGDGTKTPLTDHSVDVIICNQVYEHVDDQAGLVREIGRLLTSGGFCYFGAGNRFVLVEGHYFLPFLSWIPKRLAHLYLRLMGRRVKYDVGLLSLRNLRRVLSDFEIIDYTRKIICDPVKYDADDMIRPGSFRACLSRRLFRIFYPLFPAWVWVIRPRRKY